MKGTPESLHKRANGDTVRRAILAGAGKVAYPLMLKIATGQVLQQYKLEVSGRENIPNGPSVIVAPHQTRQDVSTWLVAAGRPINALVDIAGDSTAGEWLPLEMMDVTATMRGDHDIAKERQEISLQEMERKLRKGQTQLVFSEGTYSPFYDNMLKLWTGGSVGVARKTDSPVIPAMGVYTPANNGVDIEIAHFEFMEPFDPKQYSDLVTAAKALENMMRGWKKEMQAKYNPGMTQADWSAFRRAQAEKFPSDRDYFENAEYSLNHKLAKTPGEKAEIERWFGLDFAT